MKLAYLLNTYPMTSTTFIRREIEAIEREGIEVTRFAIRRWPERLVDPDDMRELERTHYVMNGRGFALAWWFLFAAVSSPLSWAAAFLATLQLSAAARGNRLRPFAYFVQAAYLRRQLKDAEVTHVHAHFSTNAAAVAMLCRLLGGPTYSFTVHGPDELMDPASLCLELKVRHAKSVVAITQYCRSRILSFISPTLASRVEIIPCGLDLRVFPKAPTLPQRSQTLVCVGRLCPQKGQIHIPGAAALLRTSHPDLRILLIGDGESRAEIEREIDRHGVGEMVRLEGWGSNQRVREALLQSKALLLPSYHEGLPIVIMEAFAVFRPVVTTRIAGIPELVDSSCGWLVEPGDEAALAAAIAAAVAVAPAQFAKMGQEGRRRVEARHNIDRVARALLSTFGWPSHDAAPGSAVVHEALAPQASQPMFGSEFR